MVEADIRGKKFPLCLTVAALDAINEKCGSLSQLSEFVRVKEDISVTVSNTAWLLALLIEEGENNRVVCASLAGESAARQPVPSADDLRHILTPAGAIRYRILVMQAVAESMTQEIEATPSKNVESAERM
ncbi:MAG: hypothetical protein IJO56_05915 [Oscillospiraceae bacterium]|nr:hypothetical protein [Oscillospiraceae bacterium]